MIAVLFVNEKEKLEREHMNKTKLQRFLSTVYIHVLLGFFYI